MEKNSQEKNGIVYIGDSNDDSSYFEEEENDGLSINDDLNDQKAWGSWKDDDDEFENQDRETDKSISIEKMFEKLDIEFETENVMRDFIFLNDYFDKNPNKRDEYQIGHLEIPEKYSYLLNKSEQAESKIIKEIETENDQNKLCAKNEENDKLKLIMNAIEILEVDEAMASKLTPSMTSTLKKVLQINGSDENNNDNSHLSHITESNKTNLLDKSAKSSNRSRSRLRAKEDEDFTAEEKTAIRSMLHFRQSNPSPNPSNHSYSILNSNNEIRANFGSVKNMTYNYNRNDYYNQQRALINTHIANNSSLPPPAQHNMMNCFSSNIHPSLINNTPPNHLIKSYSSSHSAYAYDPNINY